MCDFNDILAQTEKRGRARQPHALIRGFRESVDDCGLMEIGIVGYQFTWERARGNPHLVEEKLDEGLANQSFFYF